MASDKYPSENLHLEGKYVVKEAADLQITGLDEERSYLGATAKSVLSHIRNIVTKLKAVDSGNLYQGNLDCSTNPNYPAATKDQYWRVSVAGKVGGVSGTIVEIGDMIYCLADTIAGTEAAVGSYFQIQQANINRAYVIAGNDAYTTDLETNTLGLASAIDLANEVKARLNSHFADAGNGALTSCITLANALKVTMNLHLNDQGSAITEHKAKTDQIDAADATDLATLITLTTELLAVYAAHDDDAILAAPVIHQAQGTEKALTSADAPTNIHLCLTRLNDLKTKLNDHMDDATAHADGDTTQNATAAAAYVEEHIAAQNAVATANATDLASLKTLIGALLTAYDAHDGDAELPAGWTVHIGQESGDASLASTVAPTTLALCITRINDLKAKLNTHVVDGTGAHVDGNSDTVAGVDAAAGAVITIPCTGAQSDDIIVWSILDDGTNNVKGVSALASGNTLQFTFSGDPVGDTIISYMVVRPAEV